MRILDCSLRDDRSKFIINRNFLKPLSPIVKHRSKSLLLNIFQNDLYKARIYSPDKGEKIRDFFSVDVLVETISQLIMELSQNK